MKILLVSDTYEPQINGLVTALKIQAETLKQKGHEVHLLVPHLKDYQDPSVITFPCFPFLRLNRFRIPLPFSVKKFILLRRLGIDLIHTHTPFSIGIYALIVGKLLGIPLVHTYHTYFEEYLHYVRLQNWFGKWLVRLFSAWYCNRMTTVIVPSRFIRDLLLRYGVRTKIDVIPTGINLRRFSGPSQRDWRRILKIPPRARVLLFVGRVEKEKNLYFLLDTFKELSSRHPDAYLVITGDGSEKKHLERYMRGLCLGEKVRFTGFVKARYLKDVYRSSDLFVFPSLTETEGLVLLEAMLNDVPVVSFYEKGTKTLLPAKKRPGITPVRGPREFKKEIEDFLRHGYDQKIVTRNLRAYAKRFDEELFTEKLIRTYSRSIFP